MKARPLTLKKEISLSFVTSHKTQRNVALLGKKNQQKMFPLGEDQGGKETNCASRNELRTSWSSAFSCYPQSPAPTRITALKSNEDLRLEPRLKLAVDFLSGKLLHK